MVALYVFIDANNQNYLHNLCDICHSLERLVLLPKLAVTKDVRSLFFLNKPAQIVNRFY